MKESLIPFVLSGSLAGKWQGNMSHSSPAELKSLIHARLTESGEKERLREHLRARLIECGWRDQVRERNTKTM